MQNQYIFLLVMLALLPVGSSDAQTLVQFGKTINFLEHIQPAVVPTFGKKITGFRVVVPSGELRRTMTVGPLSQILNGFQDSDPPCPYQRVETLRHGTSLVSRLDWVGSVPGTDISDDDDCVCETHLSAIYFHGVYVYYSDGSMVSMPEPKLPGRIVLCPNQQDGHLVTGESYFSGAINARLTFTLRVADDEMSLLADIFYQITPYTD